MNMRTADKIIKAAESLDWSVTYESGEFDFQKYSPAGQDFNMSITGNTLDELKENLYEWYRSYDCSEEAYLWLDKSGHGTNGAPYNMKDLYDDMQACEDMVKELAEKIQEIRIPEKQNNSPSKKNRDYTR